MPRNFLVLVSLSVLASVPQGLLHGQPRSWKRGVSANSLTNAQVEALAPGVSWVYNWGASPGSIYVEDEMEFIPMCWGANQGTLDAVKAYLDSGATPTAILGLNEPNLRGQAFITPEASANWMETMYAQLQG